MTDGVVQEGDLSCESVEFYKPFQVKWRSNFCSAVSIAAAL